MRQPLFIPVRDRRSRRRILTLKNAGKALLVIALALLGITIRARLAQIQPGDYGRLFGSQVTRTEVVTTTHADVIMEAPAVADQNAADPLLVTPAAREEILGTPPQGLAAESKPVAAPEPIVAPAAEPGARIAIGNDGGGITVASSSRKLRGGFGKPQ